MLIESRGTATINKKERDERIKLYHKILIDCRAQFTDNNIIEWRDLVLPMVDISIVQMPRETNATSSKWEIADASGLLAILYGLFWDIGSMDKNRICLRFSLQ